MPSTTHMPRGWLVVLAAFLALGLIVALPALVILRPYLSGEYDGSRDLGDSCTLWMLKGYPTFIQPDASSSTGECIPPEKPDPKTASHQVDRYARLNSTIFVVATVYGGSSDHGARYFTIDTTSHHSTELKDLAAFETAIRAAGATIDSLKWRRAVPGG